MADVHDGAAFPRGGKKRPSSSIEKKETVERIRDDFLFGKNDGPKDAVKTQRPKKSKKTKNKQSGNKKKHKSVEEGDAEDDIVRTLRVAMPPRIQYLSAKRVQVGMKLFGVVKSINDSTRNPVNGSIVVSLPNGMNGLVRYKDVSDELAQIAASKTEKANAPLLSSLLRIGQYICCVVTLAMRSSGDKTGNRLELATNASAVNKGCFTEDLAEANSVVFGSIKSIEDHGYIVGLGMGNRLTGFISYAIAGGNLDKPALQVGEPVYCVVLPDSKSTRSSTGTSRSITLSNDSSTMASTCAKLSDSIAISSLRPGMLVDAKVQKVLPNGLWVTFLGVFSGAIDWFHLGMAPKQDWAKAFLPPSEIKSVKARILYVDGQAGYATLTMSPHVVAMENLSTEPEIGQLATVRIEQVEAKLGVLVSFTKETPEVEEEEESDGESSAKIGESSEAYGYAHISALVDGRLDHMEKKFKVGMTRECRVVGKSPLDGFHMISFRPSILGASVLRYDDLAPGMEVKAEVSRVGSFGVVVSMGNSVTGVVSNTHLAESTVKDPAKRFKAGQSVTCRVLSVEAKSRKAQLTMKPSLLKTKLPVISRYEDVIEGQSSHGFISSMKSVGVFVTFYNGVHGVVPTKALAAHGIQDPSKVYRVGQVMKTRVVEINAKKRKMILSFRTAKGTDEEEGTKKRSVDQVSSEAVNHSIGSIVNGTVVRVTDHDIYVRLQGSGSAQEDIRGRIPKYHLSDHICNCDGLLSTYVPGSTISGALILDIPTKKIAKRARSEATDETDNVHELPFLLTMKPSLVLAARNAALPSAIEQVHKTQMLVGYVANVTPFGVFVRFLGTLAGLAPKANVSDIFVSNPAEHCVVGQTVRAQVVDIDVSAKRMVITLKPSVVGGRDPFFLHGLWTEQKYVFAKGAKQSSRAAKKGKAEDDAEDKLTMVKLKLGQVVKATVQAIKDYGLILELEQGVIAFCMTEHMPKDTPAVGSEVETRILDLDFSKGIVDVSMRQRLIKPASDGKIPSAQVEQLGPGSSAVVELVKENYVILSLPKMQHAFVMAPVNSFNGKIQGLDALSVGIRCHVRMFEPPAIFEEESVKRQGTLPIPVVEVVPEANMGSRRPRSMSDPFDAMVPGSALALEHGHGEKVDLEVGKVVAGKVFGVRNGWVNVKLLNASPMHGADHRVKGKIHLCDLQDASELGQGDNVLSVLSVGQFLPKCKVLATDMSTNDTTGIVTELATLSTKQSDLAKSKKASKIVAPTWETIKVGKTYPGWVQSVNKNGLWVCLSPEVRGFVYCANISSNLEEIAAVFEDVEAGPTDQDKLNKHFPAGKFLPAVKVTGLSADDKVAEFTVVSAK